MQHDYRHVVATYANVRPDRQRGGWARLLEQVLALGQGHAELVRHAERPWASATFCGSRHTVEIAFAGEAGIAAGEELIAGITDREFDLPGQIVADASVTRAQHALLPAPALAVEIELLLLEDI